MASKLPLLDISKYYSNRPIFVEELRRACHTVGFFLLRHRLPDGLAETMLDESREFFSRPRHEKMKIFYGDCPSFRGYMPLGVENTRGQTDMREQVEYSAEYPNEGRRWPLYERLQSKRNPWPDSFQPNLRISTLDYAAEACTVGDCIRDALCIALAGSDEGPSLLSSQFAPNQEKNELPHWAMKLISYPPHSSQQQRQGVGAHTDSNFLTLVLQDTVGGLQVYCGHDTQWIDVPTHHGSSVWVCNLGEQAETWSRGYFRATPHRVLGNTSSHRRSTRISVPFFYNPNLSATMEPVEEIHAPWEREDADASWKPPGPNVMLTRVGDNTFKSLARSHPDVFAKHHGDLRVLRDGRIVAK